MRQVEELAARLVQYDRELAADVVHLVVDRLGGPQSAGDGGLARAHAFLARADASTVDEPKTTSEWKLEWAQRERLRSLGLLLADMLE